MRYPVLIVDDDPVAARVLAACVASAGCEAVVAGESRAALDHVRRRAFALVFLDLQLGAGDGDGLDLLRALLAERGDLAVVMLTAHAGVETAVEAMRRGARDYLAKPFAPERIAHLVADAVERRRLAERVAELEGRLRREVPGIDLDSDAPAMRAAVAAVAKAAASDATVLLRGESGTGKGVLARAIHDRSRRAAAPFVVINCPTLSEELLASELFGHAKGSFTGATRDQAGRVEAAEGGTLFLDEVSEIRPALQAKLLRFLQDREFERVGETRTRRADVRLVAATNRDLEAAVRAGEFREDLYYRLGVVEIAVPPLRERRDDVLALARGFLAFFAMGAGKRLVGFAPEVERLLVVHPWPGNVRELRNAIERAVVFAAGPEVVRADLPPRLGSAAPAEPRGGPELGGDCTLAEIEREHLERVVARDASLDEAAQILGIDPSTLFRKRRRR